MKETKKSWI